MESHARLPGVPIGARHLLPALTRADCTRGQKRIDDTKGKGGGLGHEGHLQTLNAAPITHDNE